MTEPRRSWREAIAAASKALRHASADLDGELERLRAEVERLGAEGDADARRAAEAELLACERARDDLADALPGLKRRLALDEGGRKALGDAIRGEPPPDDGA